MNLSENFTLEELITTSFRQFDNVPNEQEIQNLKRLATVLEQVRALFGKPVLINSGFRCKQVNDAVGSKDTSAHRKGLAADFRINGLTPDQICKKIIASDIKFDQLIREYDRWVHIGLSDNPLIVRSQKLIIDVTGTRVYT